ncbi:MAG: NAD(P)-dependent oxidoreductase [Candidatus Thorarchaeota archaeon]
MNEKPAINILCIWQPNEKLKNYLLKGLKAYPQVNLIIPKDTSNETFIQLAKKHKPEIIMGWRPTKELLETAENLKLFINPGAGIQHLIPLFKELTKERDITLVNGHGNSYFTAQHAVALLLTLSNKVITHHNWMVQGLWRRGDTYATSIPIRDRKIGLLGYGAVNQKVHKLLSGFDVEFSILRREWSKKEESLPTPVNKYTINELHLFLKEVDILIVAIPLTEKTEGLLGKDELKLLGKDGLLVNMGRGSVIDEESLYSVLRDEIIAGAAIDVWYNYQPEPTPEGLKYPSSYPFHTLENVVLSPHRGASPMSDLRRWDEQIEIISQFARGEKKYLNTVNINEGY